MSQEFDGAHRRDGAAGFPAVITFSGFRRGLSTSRDEEHGGRLKKIAVRGEEAGDALSGNVELTRARRNERHPDYFCDSMDRSVEIIKRWGRSA